MFSVSIILNNERNVNRGGLVEWWYNRGMQDAKEEIKARLAVEEIVGQYIELKKAGRNYKGRSPWGVDKTPSLMVSPDKGIWHDFSANKGGDIFTFVMEVEGISFREALQKLANQAGVELAKYEGGDKAVARKKARAREALELAAKYYQYCLSQNKQVMEYVFYKRNLNRRTVKEFRIGYGPSSGRALVGFLEKKGFSRQEMADAGLLNQYGGDMFRGRMMVPFIDLSGVIGFTARVLDKSEPKYLNTSETLLFNKGRFIFGYAQAKEAIRKNGFVVIVEGNMDVISSHQAGVKEAVATSGTAMTEMHLKQLSRLTNDIRLAYDGDAAGVRATERAIKMAATLGIRLSVISDYGGAKDPDELIQRGAELWQKAVAAHEPAVEWVLKKYRERVDMATAEGKQEYADLAMELIECLPPVQQKHYRDKVAMELEVAPDELKGAKKGPKRRLRPIKKTEGGVKNSEIIGVEKDLLAIYRFSGMEIDTTSFTTEAMEEELSMIFEMKYAKYDETELKNEVKLLIARRKKMLIATEIEKLSEELEKVEDDVEKTDMILNKIRSLQKNNE